MKWRTGEKSAEQDILKGVHLFFTDVLSDFVLRLLEFFATMSSDEFKNGQKNNPPRLREGVVASILKK